jgi:hypothetical protein
MLLKYIQHFVSPEGRAFFPEWFASTTDKLKHIKGFVTAHYVFDSIDSSTIHFFMYFEDAEALARWTASDTHVSVLKRLSPYWIKPYVMQEAIL